jgi:hypothetical protein
MNFRTDSSIKRQEEKFFLDQVELSNILIRFDASPTYPSRSVNSLYFDCSNFVSFHESEEGVVPRRKYRFRWYGESNYQFGTPGAIEVKETCEQYRLKETLRAKPSSIASMQRLFREKCINYLFPVCQISYTRAYFANISGLRFTYDFDIKARQQGSNSFLKIPSNIFEVKYTSQINRQIFSALTGDRKTRFSKYNEAVQRLHIL